MDIPWSEIFDNYGIKRVSKTDKSKKAYLPNLEQQTAIAAAGIMPSEERPGAPLEISVLFDKAVNSVEASFYYSARSEEAERDPEPRMGRELISLWAEQDDVIVLGNIGRNLYAAKVTSASPKAIQNTLAQLSRRGRPGAATTPYRIGWTDDHLFDARIEVVNSSAILFSRSGASGERPARNSEYGQALEVICYRAVKGSLTLRRVLIDSATARLLPVADRVLLAREQIEGMTSVELASEVRTRLRRFGQEDGTKGGNSTKQVRFDFDLRHSSVIQSLRLRKWTPQSGASANRPPVRLLSHAEQRKVTTLQIRFAVDRLLSGEDMPGFSESRDYDLITSDGQRLAPKKVFGLALEMALGIKARPGHFHAGRSESSFELLEEAGYRIVSKDGADPSRQERKSRGPELPSDPEERSWAEGEPRMRTHLRTERRRDPRAAAEKRRQLRAENQGRLVCENALCKTDWYAIFPAAIAEGVFEIHHTVPLAEMQEGHQTVVEDLCCLCASCHRAEHRRMSLGNRHASGLI